MNTFEFLRPFLRSLDYDLPKFTISVPFALSLGKVVQGVYTVLYPWLSKSWLPQPLILPAEVYKVTSSSQLIFHLRSQTKTCMNRSIWCRSVLLIISHISKPRKSLDMFHSRAPGKVWLQLSQTGRRGNGDL